MADKHDKAFILWFDDILIEDVALIGGKNASLGEMYQKLSSKGVAVPHGFAITSYAYRHLIKTAGIENDVIDAMAGLDTHDMKNLQERGKKVRGIIRNAEFPDDLRQAIVEAYRKMEEEYGPDVDVAVRSSATAEDLPDASFAGQQESFLNIRGVDALIENCRKCFASLFTNRAISYRHDKGFGQFDVYLSIAVQKMVRSDAASSGVIFSIDTESGFKDAVFITGSWGLGENVVLGVVNPDEYYVFKPTLKQGKHPIVGKRVGTKELKMIYNSDPNAERTVRNIDTTPEERGRYILSDDEIIQLAKWTCIIEDHYQKPMDIEWAKDGDGVNTGTGKLYIVQARPETVHSQSSSKRVLETYVLKEKGKIIASGQAVGAMIGQGVVRVIEDAAHIQEFRKGEVLVTDMTDPDWEPIMKIASAIVTNRGGRTCHAAIISRELGIPCVIGTGNGSKVIKSGNEVTVSCAEGEIAYIYEGLLKFVIDRLDLDTLPPTKTHIMMNVGIPERAFSECQIPNDGVGLAREEFIINSHIGIHPLALYYFDDLKAKADAGDKKIAEIIKEIETRTTAYPDDKKQFFIDKLAEGVGRIGAGFYPKDVIVRLSDFKSNEYANLVGGTLYEPLESNPMIGWRGASRYYDKKYKPAFELECMALLKARNDMGLTNIKLMVPFCRTPEEGRKVIEVLKEFGLVQGENGLEVYVMCEIPSNVISADAFSDVFDGFSIGSNDLTQLTLGLDRDSDLVAHIFDERNEAVKTMVRMVIDVAKRRGKKIGICGQAPSDFPEFATFLVECGIDSMSLIPDTVIKTRLAVAEKERELGIKAD
ncbi:MAG: phosphoenolpyruvate synthase [Proteobacteria bacterium]|nr:phosphoenolpyruvate synthase [Desulfobacteraceae bacterium]MBU4012440.1 phosphoenolpyruvate synthase [Pseudomonadota bacterium]MBU4067772.1 phosphoenolpyruvate synthase [Pseudomonadota bacterium]MBU4099939.1 phosphoenolpyruvate synthase [Pseudomonadota bacterium]MBU4128377.1 phosphoenolpyruvate synthase [Pseudomonadota bacterium]